MTARRKRPCAPSDRLPKNLYAVLDGDLSSLHATIVSISRQIGSLGHATEQSARGAKGTAGKRLICRVESQTGEAMKPGSNLVEFHPIKNSPERGASK